MRPEAPGRHAGLTCWATTPPRARGPQPQLAPAPRVRTPRGPPGLRRPRSRRARGHVTERRAAPPLRAGSSALGLASPPTSRRRPASRGTCPPWCRGASSSRWQGRGAPTPRTAARAPFPHSRRPPRHCWLRPCWSRTAKSNWPGRPAHRSPRLAAPASGAPDWRERDVHHRDANREGKLREARRARGQPAPAGRTNENRAPGLNRNV